MALSDAGARIAEGRIVALPTETVFGLAASASNAAALDQLWQARGDGQRVPLAWHLPSAADVLEILATIQPNGEVPPAHRRLVERLLPGPVMLAVPMPADRLVAVRERARVEPGVFDDGSELLLRVPDHPVAVRAIRDAGTPVVVSALPGADPRFPARSAAEAWAQLERAGSDGRVEGIVTEGPAPIGKPSTLVRLTASGGFDVLREGAIAERFIRKQLTRTILFVCTGNTCRSPMAEAIARHLFESAGRTNGDGVTTRVRSAGASASSGAPATAETIVALREVGVDATAHRSTPISRELLQDADVIFGMTASHVGAILAMDPGAAGRTFILDPEGRDVPDPIGQSQDAYIATAQRLKDLIQRRFSEFRFV